MSGLAGILRFDPRDRVSHDLLADLARGLDRLGPDGGEQAIETRVGFVFRAFHTTPESHLETQPLVREHVILAFDGRLDNREQLCSLFKGGTGQTLTDVDLVYLAYKEWGLAFLGELMGDWAISLWDRSANQLILARDIFGVRRLFYRVDEGGITWCTALEPLVKTYPGSLHLDLDYIAGCLYPRPPVERTPFQEIRACVPSSMTLFGNQGLIEVRPYWKLNPYAAVRYNCDEDYEIHFRRLFRDAVLNRQRSDRPILAELSGGLDSSSIVCMADRIRTESQGSPIETLSFFDPEEPSGDERPHFLEIEHSRQRPGHHISIADFIRESPPDRVAPLPKDCFSAVPGFFSNSLRWDRKIGEVQRLTNARIILSGLGGDELLGGVQYEAPELVESARNLKLLSFFQSLFKWSVARRKSMFQLLRATIQLLRAPGNQKLLTAYDGSSLTWALVSPPHPGTAFRDFARWKELNGWALCAERIRFSLAQQLSNTEPPLVGCNERRYPFLDRSLFIFLASIPRIQILQPGKRRFLMRRAMRGIVPDSVLYRRTKWFGYRRPLVALRHEHAALKQLFDEPWLSDGVVSHASLIREHLELALHGSTDDALALISAVGIEQWMRALVRNVDLASPNAFQTAPQS